MIAEAAAHLTDDPRLTPEQASNARRLRQCAKPHVFELRLGADGLPIREHRCWACRLCGGVVRSEARSWYLIGLSDGRRKAGRAP